MNEKLLIGECLPISTCADVSFKVGSGGMQDFTRISQAIGTNIQKINSNGELMTLVFPL